MAYVFVCFPPPLPNSLPPLIMNHHPLGGMSGVCKDPIQIYEVSAPID